MAQRKLVERKAQFHAWETYRDLGYGRSYSQVARQLGYHHTTIMSWAKKFKWDERLKEHTEAVAEKMAKGDLIKVDDPIVKKLTDAMDKMEAIINSVFHKTTLGTFEPNIKVKTMDELSKFVGEYRKFLETYHSFVSEYMPSEHKKDRSTSIKEFNVYMENVSQEERIAMMKGLTGESKHKRSIEVKEAGD